MTLAQRWRSHRVVSCFLFLIWALASNPLTLQAAAHRLVSLTPSITEILFALGAGDDVVGVTSYCSYPPEARNKQAVGDILSPNFEIIVSLKPTLVLAQKDQLRNPQILRNAGIPIVEVQQRTVQEILKSILLIGKAIDREKEAQHLVHQIIQELETIRQKASLLPRRRVLFIVGRTPGRLEGLFAVGPNNFLNDLIEIAGGVNVLKEASAAYPKITIEQVIALNPEVIIDRGDFARPEDATPERLKAAVSLWKQLASVDAVRHSRVYAVGSDEYVIPGPRIAQAAWKLFRMIHPEAQK